MIRERSPGVIATIAAALLFVLAAGVPRAVADTATYTISIGNSAISGFTGPYATVSVDRTSSTMATITFTSLTNSGNIYLMGDGGTVAVNVNATSWTLGTITGSNSGTGFTPGPWTNGGAGTEDGFGSFNQTINSFDGFTHSSDTISFTLTDTGGTWADAAAVLAANGSGNFVADHVFVTTDPANASNTALATGYGTSDKLNPAPEASTVTLASLVILAFGALLVRSRRNGLA